MTAEKKTEHGSKPAGAADAIQGRKPWIPKSPVEVVLEQIKKQENKVTELQEELNKEKVLLDKLLQAKKVLEVS